MPFVIRLFPTPGQPLHPVGSKDFKPHPRMLDLAKALAHQAAEQDFAEAMKRALKRPEMAQKPKQRPAKKSRAKRKQKAAPSSTSEA